MTREHTNTNAKYFNKDFSPLNKTTSLGSPTQSKKVQSQIKNLRKPAH